MTSGDISETPVEDNRSTDLDGKEDIVYQARPVATNEFDEKSATASGDESIDSESAGELSCSDDHLHTSLTYAPELA